MMQQESIEGAREVVHVDAESRPLTPPSSIKLEQPLLQHDTDLPSPPASVTKTPAYQTEGSIDHDETPQQPKRELSQDNVPDYNRASSSTSGVQLTSPPSPPPSTHSNEEATSPLRPAYFYPQPSDAVEHPDAAHITPEEAPGVPVFQPTWEEFKDFYTYCQRIDEWGMKCGIVKIIPPREWVESLPRLDGRMGSTSFSSPQSTSGARYSAENPLSQIRIKNSIEQLFYPAGPGSWRQSNVVHPARILNAKQWLDLCGTDGQKGPELSRMRDIAKRSEEEGDGAEEDGVRTRSGRGNKVQPPGVPPLSARPSTKRKRNAETAKEETAESETVANASIDDMPALEQAETSKSATKLKIADRTTQEEWDSFDYVEGWCREAGQDCRPQDWNPAICKAIESEYWRGLNFGKAPMYGADLQGTLFTPATGHWNVGCLDNLLTRLRLRRKLPGVTTPYLYFGMWRATFAWHVEDMDLYSINYIHFGAPKQWYAIRQNDRQRFELTMAGAFPGDSARCRHFMRHKSYLASPAFLAAAAGIKPLRLVQKAQEFVITYPYGYHSGFNLGFNCAESVNFALESWLDIGRKAGYCDCASDSVKMDVDAMLEESKEMEELDRKREERERKREAEEKLLQSEQEKLDAKRAKERERRRLKKEEHRRLEALGLPIPGKDRLDGELDAPPAKKLKTQGLPCILCPSASEEDLVAIPHPDGKAEQIKKPLRYAHRLCACFMPETWVAPNPDYSKGSSLPKEIVMGFSGIEKLRWSLKCQNCIDPASSKKGAKVQCTYGKCSRTTHVSCALYLSSGWMLDMLPDEQADVLEGKAKKATAQPKPELAELEMDHVMTEGGSHPDEEDSPVRTVILCRSHNPVQRERDALRRAHVLRRSVELLKVGQKIKVRTSSGMWETVLQEVYWPEDKREEGEIVADEDQVIKWSKIQFEADLIKKAEEEQTRLDEEEATLLQQEEAAAVERTRVPADYDLPVVDETEILARKEEAERKEKEKAASLAAKEAARQAREEQRRLKEMQRMEKQAVKEAKAAERQAKEKMKAEKRADREAKAAEKQAKMAEKHAKAAGQLTKAGGANGVKSSGPPAPPDRAAAKPVLPDYIRLWAPTGPQHHQPHPHPSHQYPLHKQQQQHQHNSHHQHMYQAPRPHLPPSASGSMERILAPFPARQQQTSSYPPHLATFQMGAHQRAAHPDFERFRSHAGGAPVNGHRSYDNYHSHHTAHYAKFKGPSSYARTIPGYPNQQHPLTADIGEQSSLHQIANPGSRHTHQAAGNNHPMLATPSLQTGTSHSSSYPPTDSNERTA